jgi:Tfp pilus assembly protein PilO
MTITQLQSQLQWHFARIFERLSMATKLAIALFGLLLASYFLLIKPQSIQLQSLTSKNHFKANSPALTSTVSEVDTYIASFPTTQDRASKINDLMQLANNQQLVLDDVKYKNLTDSNGVFNRYQVDFSVFASYPEIHAFLSKLLTEMPYVSLESLNLSRESVMDAQIEARIQLVFYLGNRA